MICPIKIWTDGRHTDRRTNRNGTPTFLYSRGHETSIKYKNGQSFDILVYNSLHSGNNKYNFSHFFFFEEAVFVRIYLTSGSKKKYLQLFRENFYFVRIDEKIDTQVKYAAV